MAICVLDLCIDTTSGSLKIDEIQTESFPPPLLGIDSLYSKTKLLTHNSSKLRTNNPKIIWIE